MCFQLQVKIYHSALFSDPLLLVHWLLGSWKYTCGLIMDDNFKAENLHDQKAEDQDWLMDGLGFMVSEAEYKTYLSTTNTLQEVTHPLHPT